MAISQNPIRAAGYGWQRGPRTGTGSISLSGAQFDWRTMKPLSALAVLCPKVTTWTISAEYGPVLTRAT